MQCDNTTASLTAGKNERNSNLELLRIICMFFLIIHHCVVHGGSVWNATGLNWYIAWFFVPIGKICFNTFLAISAWFLVDKAFKSERFFKTWLQVFFYSIGGAALAFFLGLQMTWRDGFSALFPITGNSHGFAAAYLAFYLLTPFLSIVAKRIGKKPLAFLIIILLYFQVFSKGIAFITQYTQNLYSELQLFVLVYFIVLYFKKFGIKIFEKRTFNIIVVLISWVLLFVMMCLRRQSNNYIELFFSINNDESGIIYIISGCSLFFLFKNINIKTNIIINKIAGTTFGILLIHDHNFLRPLFWKNILHVQDWYLSSYFGLYLFLTSLTVFIVCALIELIRQIIFNNTIYKLQGMKKIFNKIDECLNYKEGVTIGKN